MEIVRLTPEIAHVRFGQCMNYLREEHCPENNVFYLHIVWRDWDWPEIVRLDYVSYNRAFMAPFFVRVSYPTTQRFSTRDSPFTILGLGKEASTCWSVQFDVTGYVRTEPVPLNPL